MREAVGAAAGSVGRAEQVGIRPGDEQSIDGLVVGVEHLERGIALDAAQAQIENSQGSGFSAMALPLRFLASFFVLRVGWAVGALLFMTFPNSWPSAVWMSLPVAFLAGMGIVDVFLFVRMSRSLEQLAGEDGESRAEGEMSAYEFACDRVAEHYGLTKRESEVLRCLGKGRASRYIQQEMVISSGTARTHIDHIYKKLNVHSQQDLIDIVEASLP